MNNAENSTHEFEFTNEFGEWWRVVIDAQSRTGILIGDELGDDAIKIRDRYVGGGLFLNDEEFRWLSDVWLKTTGQKLAPTFLQKMENLAAQLKRFGDN